MAAPEDRQQPRSAWRQYGREFLILWRLSLAQLLSRWWMIFLIVGVGFVLILAARGMDQRLLEQIRRPENETLNEVALLLSVWGNVYWAVILAVVLFALGAWCGCPRWRQVCHACLIAALLSTIAVSILRPMFGRARPYATLPDGFYGPGWNSRYHGFPSGHATSAFASATAVAAASPLLGVPCLLFAGSVSWSRLQLNEHHPLDVITGAALGTFIGLCCGSAVPGTKIRFRRKRVGT
jgi:membrane-associated phospholipid phosphatase